jgi:hypothetical protein
MMVFFSISTVCANILNAIYFRAQKFMSELNVLVVYLSRTLVIIIASSIQFSRPATEVQLLG